MITNAFVLFSIAKLNDFFKSVLKISATRLIKCWAFITINMIMRPDHIGCKKNCICFLKNMKLGFKKKLYIQFYDS